LFINQLNMGLSDGDAPLHHPREEDILRLVHKTLSLGPTVPQWAVVIDIVVTLLIEFRHWQLLWHPICIVPDTHMFPKPGLNERIMFWHFGLLKIDRHWPIKQDIVLVLDAITSIAHSFIYLWEIMGLGGHIYKQLIGLFCRFVIGGKFGIRWINISVFVDWLLVGRSIPLGFDLSIFMRFVLLNVFLKLIRIQSAYAFHGFILSNKMHISNKNPIKQIKYLNFRLLQSLHPHTTNSLDFFFPLMDSDRFPFL
jgi:hypothetical protein